MSRSEELELQLSPNRWSRRYRAEEIVEKHVEFISKASDAAKKFVPCQLDVPYGPADKEKLDIFGTNLPDDSPIFIYVHGGGFNQELTKDVSSYIVEPLHQFEFKVIVVGYTPCPQATFPQIMEQIQRAFTKSLEYAKGKNSRGLYLCGHSHGASLVATLFQSYFSSLSLEDQSLLKGVFLISGLYDLKPLTRTYHNDVLRLDGTTAFKLSPLFQSFRADKQALFFVVVGENDTPTYKDQSDSFYTKLKSLGYTAELIVVSEVDHYDIVENMNDENYEIVRLIVSMEINDY